MNEKKILTLFLFYVHGCFTCICVCAIRACNVFGGLEKAMGNMQQEIQKVTKSLKSLTSIWVLRIKSCPLEKQPELLTTEQSLQLCKNE